VTNVSRELFPPAPEGSKLIHTRKYEVRTYKLSEDHFLLRGVVCDEKPVGLYIPGDTEPLWMHHMMVDLTVAYPSFVIEKADVTYYEHPHETCTPIAEKYHLLEGLSIARGFNNKVKELFGGPRGCTHIGALLAAMAPVAIQSAWSMRVGNAFSEENRKNPDSIEQRRRAYAMNLNTCHVWAEDGELVAAIDRGEQIEVPLSVRRRLAALGRPDSDWDSIRS